MYRNNRDKVMLGNKFLAIFLMLCAGIVLCLLMYPGRANSGPYLDSAHAQSYGVNRSSISSLGYSVGNCAHCHEQHSSIGGAEPPPNSPAGPDYYLLFQDLWISPPQSNEFCFGCHTGVSSLQSGTLNNYSYSYRAGGDTSANCPSSVYGSFQFVTNAGVPQSNCGSNGGSSHTLRNIRNYITNQWGFPNDNTQVDPCSGCHNPHMAKRDPHLTGGTPTRTDGSGNLLVSSVSRPSQHSKDNNAWQLWGDQSGERMRDYALSAGATYQAPCRYPWSNPCTSYEPDGSAVQNGLNLFDTVTFCLDCHQNQVTSVYRGTLTAINWGPGGDAHGAQAGPQCNLPGTGIIAPYTAGTNYILSCLDCHEPHGSPNGFLLRQEVNGIQVTNFNTSQTRDGSNYFYNFCVACHTTGNHVGPPNECTQTCHHYHNGVDVTNFCSPITAKMF